ncbi:hypothetical protein tinsulaeT_25440 [Thalassotalea insulae]|uniref:Uncharacterized protein n=1 Tax=Thalassotalea insulae TaxID=2056778 RepID=A0ABQ6GV22_9GAMM|nr:hypothetical protein [Thalassotalea insulae]GLX79204.1 hypothetical protein tinsulaeT_25440 [Thalassotalea insulae]
MITISADIQLNEDISQLLEKNKELENIAPDEQVTTHKTEKANNPDHVSTMASASSYQQLAKLRSSINAQKIQNNLHGLQRFKSASVMTANPDLVLHSITKMTKDFRMYSEGALYS